MEANEPVRARFRAALFNWVTFLANRLVEARLSPDAQRLDGGGSFISLEDSQVDNITESGKQALEADGAFIEALEEFIDKKIKEAIDNQLKK